MSGLIPTTFITELLTRVDIVELIDARVPLKKAGRNHHACCPFHSEKTPSFTVSPSKQFYHCFGCGASGNAIGFLIQYERLDFVSAVETLAKQLGLEVPHQQGSVIKHEKSVDLYDVLQIAQQFYIKQLRTSSTAIAYLKNRGITGEIAKRYAIGFATASWDGLLSHLSQPQRLLKAGLVLEKEGKKGYYDRFRDRIMFPIRDRRGRVIGFGGRVLDNSLPKYLNSPETEVFHKSHVLYGLYEARQVNAALEQLIVVEGYMDVVALAQAGITDAVATLGTATTQFHVQQLFQNTNKIIFCFDGDKAGQSAAWRALESTLPVLQDNTQANFLFLPQGEDPDSFVNKMGVEVLQLQLQQAMSLADFFFLQLKQGLNLASVEGRAQLAHAALPRIEKITAPLTHEMMLDKLAELVRIEKSRLNHFMNTPIEKEPALIAGNLQKTPMRLAIALLLQYPQLAQDIAIDLINLSLPGSELLQQIYAIIKDSPQSTTASILEHWRDQDALTFLHKLAAWSHGVPEQGLIAEWQGVLQHLQKQQRQFVIEDLLRKVNQGLLTDTERAQLQILLAENKKE